MIVERKVGAPSLRLVVHLSKLIEIERPELYWISSRFHNTSVYFLFHLSYLRQVISVQRCKKDIISPFQCSRNFLTTK